MFAKYIKTRFWLTLQLAILCNNRKTICCMCFEKKKKRNTVLAIFPLTVKIWSINILLHNKTLKEPAIPSILNSFPPFPWARPSGTFAWQVYQNRSCYGHNGNHIAESKAQCSVLTCPEWPALSHTLGHSFFLETPSPPLPVLVFLLPTPQASPPSFPHRIPPDCPNYWHLECLQVARFLGVGQRIRWIRTLGRL